MEGLQKCGFIPTTLEEAENSAPSYEEGEISEEGDPTSGLPEIKMAEAWVKRPKGLDGGDVDHQYRYSKITKSETLKMALGFVAQADGTPTKDGSLLLMASMQDCARP